MSRKGPAFLSVGRGHSSGCQSSPGWGDGVPPPPWEGRVHLEQEEGRGRGEATGISWCPVSAEIMGDEAEGYRRGRPSTGQVEHSSLACVLCPRNTALCPGEGAGNEIAGSRELPHPQVSVTEEEARPGDDPTYLTYPHRSVNQDHLPAVKRPSALKVSDFVALIPQWLGQG